MAPEPEVQKLPEKVEEPTPAENLFASENNEKEEEHLPLPLPLEKSSETEQNQQLPEEVSKSINTVMNYVTNEIVNKIQTPNNQNGFDAVNEATEKMFQSAGTKRKGFRLTKKSRLQQRSKSK